jgi:hypothetical protein
MAQFRVCPDSGFYFDRSAESLMKANAVAGAVSLLIAGILGLGVILTRWQEVHLLPADLFYQVLTGHGINALIFWIIFFEMAILYFASSTLLRTRLAAPRWAWAGFALMIIGMVMNNIAVLQGNSSVMMTSYAPMQAAPHFYLGLILFAVGALIGCFVFLGTLVIAKEDKTYEGSIPLVTFGALTACIIAVFTIASGAIILVPTFLWSIGYIGHIDAAMYRVIWWGLGHSSQQINVAAHVSVWYLIAGVLFGARPMSEKVSRSAFLLYILFLQLASAHHILVDPGISSEWKVFNTSYAMYLAVLASMIHGLTVPGSVEVAQRAKGYLLADHLRLHRRYHRRGHGHRADQPDHPQHHLRTGALPRHCRSRHHAGVHGADLPADSGAVPPPGIPAMDGQVAALCVLGWHDADDPVHARRGYARRISASLGHGFHRRGACFRVLRNGLHDDGGWRYRRRTWCSGWCDVPDRNRRFAVVR